MPEVSFFVMAQSQLPKGQLCDEQVQCSELNSQKVAEVLQNCLYWFLILFQPRPVFLEQASQNQYPQGCHQQGVDQDVKWLCGVEFIYFDIRCVLLISFYVNRLIYA